MGLSSGDNRLSIRDRGNNTGVSRRAVNHYLSVRWPWLHTVSSSFTLLSASIPLFLMVHSEVACFALCCSPSRIYCTCSHLLFQCSFFRGDISPFKTTERVVPFLKVSPCQQPIVTAQHLAPFEGQQVLVSFPKRHTWTHACGSLFISWNLRTFVALKQFILVSSIELPGFVYAYKQKHNLVKQSVSLGTIQIDLSCAAARKKQ